MSVGKNKSTVNFVAVCQIELSVVFGCSYSRNGRTPAFCTAEARTHDTTF